MENLQTENRVLVLDKNRQPLMPCHPARARALLREGKAAVFRRFPFTLILKHREGGEVHPVTAKADPGSKKTGLALVATFARRGPTVIWAAELTHRGAAIRKALEQRSGHRHNRRNRTNSAIVPPASTTAHGLPAGWPRLCSIGWIPR